MKRLPDTFAALGDPTRLAIVERLLDRVPLSVTELRDVSEISAPAISRHLKVLRKAGIVSRTVAAQRRIYAIEPDRVRAIDSWTRSHAAFWQGSLDRLATALAEESSDHG